MSGATNEKSLAATNDQAPGTTNTVIVRDARADDKAVAERKRQANLQAGAAHAGIALQRQADGSWLALKWNLSKALADHEVEAWLARVGVQA